MHQWVPGGIRQWAAPAGVSEGRRGVTLEFILFGSLPGRLSWIGGRSLREARGYTSQRRPTPCRFSLGSRTHSLSLLIWANEW